MKAPNPMPAGACKILHGGLLGLLALSTLALAAPPAEADFAGGLGHTCWVSPTGGVECWGLNDAGQLGDGTTLDRAYPAPVTGLGPDAIFAVGTGEAFSCALTVVGAVMLALAQLANATQRAEQEKRSEHAMDIDPSREEAVREQSLDARPEAPR